MSATPDCGACPGDGSICPKTCKLAEDSPPIAPPVAAGSVDTPGFRELLHAAVMCKSSMQIECNARLLEHLDAWGAQQREEGKAEQTAFLKECMDRGQVEFNRKWTEQKERAEKAEARVKELERKLPKNTGKKRPESIGIVGSGPGAEEGDRPCWTPDCGTM